MDHVHQVRSPVGGFSTPGFPKARESPAAAIVRMVRRGSEPEVPIESRGRIAVGRRSLFPVLARKSPAVEPGLDKGDLADLAATNHFHDFLVMLAGALLRATRHHAVVLVGRLHHLAALVN